MPGDSHFWAGLMKVKRDFLRLGRFKLGDGSQVRFWEDVCIGSRALKDSFPNVYNVVRKKSATVKTVLSSSPLNVAFRRSLVGVNLQAWHAIVAMVMNVHLTNQGDSFVWGLHQNGRFSVHSMYTVLIVSQASLCCKQIWRLKLPLKLKVFMWYLFKGVVLTKDNLARRQWRGSVQCCFCNLSESVQHLFFDCHLAKFIWRAIQVSFSIPPPLNVQHMFSD